MPGCLWAEPVSMWVVFRLNGCFGPASFYIWHKIMKTPGVELAVKNFDFRTLIEDELNLVFRMQPGKIRKSAGRIGGSHLAGRIREVYFRY